MTTKSKSSKVAIGPGRKIISIRIKEFIDDYIYRIDLDADYQREKIWSRKQQLDLLDSIIKNIDVPKIYLAAVQGSENFDFECIDGKQRMTTLLSFFKPEIGQSALTIRIGSKNYSYKQLLKDLPPIARNIEDFELTFVIYEDRGDEEFLRDIFRRLQLGVRLNSGELLKTHTGTIRNFIYQDLGKTAPFLRKTNLSEKRFSRQFTLAQICINSFSRSKTTEFVRARYDDLEEFFLDNIELSTKDENLQRIRKVLEVMDKRFGDKAQAISSRAIAVSAYLYAEELYLKKKPALISEFAKFLVALLDEIKDNLNLLGQYRIPRNKLVLEDFQKYISQASVEPYAIRRRHEFIEKAFKYYRSPEGKGKIARHRNQLNVDPSD